MSKQLIMRFWDKIEIDNNDCWVWLAFKQSNGYGQFVTKDNIMAHRFSYKLFKGDIPNGLVLDHLCRNKSCVNPDHLEAVTQRENILRGSGVNKTHCPQGHEFTLENTQLYMMRGSYRRVCRICHNLRNQSWRKNRKKNV